MKRDLLSVTDLGGELMEVIELARIMKGETREGLEMELFKGKILAMIFEKPSLRTRVSFEIGFGQLGGTALYLSPNEIRIGERESVHDVAMVLSRYVDMIMYRSFKNENMVELARHATVPVINGLDDREHPCQCVADLLTIYERKGGLSGKRLCYLGDGNNVLNSLLLGGAMLGMDVVAACPPDYLPKGDIVEAAAELAGTTGGKVAVISDPELAVSGADVVYTDTWVSMGDEKEKDERLKAFAGYQVNSELFDRARPDAIFMHCLPAHRGQEVTDDVMDSSRSAVFDQAENRLHAQKAIMARLAGLR